MSRIASSGWEVPALNVGALVLTIALAGCGRLQSPATPVPGGGAAATQHSTEPRDTEVYAAVLDSRLGQPDTRPSDKLVVGDSTSGSVYQANYVVFRRSTATGFVTELFGDFDS